MEIVQVQNVGKRGTDSSFYMKRIQYPFDPIHNTEIETGTDPTAAITADRHKFGSCLLHPVKQCDMINIRIIGAVKKCILA